MSNDYMLRGKIIQQFIACALWSSTAEDGSPLDDNFGADNIAPETVQHMRDDCAAFFFANRRDLRATGATMEQHAHDYWLTRNGHGAGFWDRGYKNGLGERLTGAAHADGSFELMECADGWIY